MAIRATGARVFGTELHLIVNIILYNGIECHALISNSVLHQQKSQR